MKKVVTMEDKPAVEKSMKKIIHDLKESIADAKRFGDGTDVKSFAYEQGVLLTANEAKTIINFYDGNMMGRKSEKPCVAPHALTPTKREYE